jgi:hypothetical protein
MTTELVTQVEQACAQLAQQRVPVTFAEVAARTRTSKATLYRRTELRSIIEEHRARGREARTLSGLAAEIDLLRQGLEALAARVRHHEELLRDLQRRTSKTR